MEEHSPPENTLAMTNFLPWNRRYRLPPGVLIARRSIVAACASLVLTAFAAAAEGTADRVGFPQDYQETFEAIRRVNQAKPKLFATIYANRQASSVTEIGQLPYPNGSVIVMEWAEPRKDETGAFRTDDQGLWLKGKVVRIDVMRREKGFGEGYGTERAGEWEFASYRPDGSPMVPAAQPASCAECHARATAERDYVFQGRFPPLKAK